MKNLLIIICCFFVIAVLDVFPSPPGRGQGEGADSTSINQKYDAKQQYLKQQYDARVDELIKTDPVLNQLKGASQMLEIERQESLTPTLPQGKGETKEDTTHVR